MSTLSSTVITLKLRRYDEMVREAIAADNVKDVMDAFGTEIVSEKDITKTIRAYKVM